MMPIIKVSLDGYCDFPRQLANQDILNYALERLEGDTDQNDNILSLAICDEEDSEENRGVMWVNRFLGHVPFSWRCTAYCSRKRESPFSRSVLYGEEL